MACPCKSSTATYRRRRSCARSTGMFLAFYHCLWSLTPPLAASCCSGCSQQWRRLNTRWILRYFLTEPWFTTTIHCSTDRYWRAWTWSIVFLLLVYFYGQWVFQDWLTSLLLYSYRDFTVVFCPCVPLDDLSSRCAYKHICDRFCHAVSQGLMGTIALNTGGCDSVA